MGFGVSHGILTTMIRIGFGFDSHRTVPPGTDSDRQLVLGGVTFPESPGLVGHSDADVLTHAIIDAILSALGEGDIGERFPDTDPQYKNISSLELLRRCCSSKGRLSQVDATVVCDAPKISLNRSRIIDSLRSVLGPDVAVSVKGKTTEGLGALGRGEGIVAFAVALVEL